MKGLLLPSNSHHFPMLVYLSGWSADFVVSPKVWQGKPDNCFDLLTAMHSDQNWKCHTEHPTSADFGFLPDRPQTLFFEEEPSKTGGFAYILSTALRDCVIEKTCTPKESKATIERIMKTPLTLPNELSYRSFESCNRYKV